jgi:uncharacterized delta-60 repeat protein
MIMISIIKKIVPLFALFLLVNSLPVKAEEPKVDPTFAGGKVTTNLTETVRQPLYERARGAALQSDGKVVVLAEVYAPHPLTLSPRIGVIRYNPDGSLDRDFGKRGHTIPIISNLTTSPQQLAIVEGNKILVVGWILNSTANSTNQALFAVRLNPDGSPDVNFGNNGQLIANLVIDPSRGTFFNPTNLQILPGGNYQVTGIVREPFPAIISARITSDGRLDGSFGRSGIMLSPALPFFIQHVSFQQDGKLLVVSRNNDITITRLNPENLTVDTSFANKGALTFTHPVQMTGSILASELPDRKIILIGAQNSSGPGRPIAQTILYRFHSDGRSDVGFGNNGRAVIADTAASLLPQTVSVDGDGNLLIGGAIDRNGLADFLVMKVLSSGTVDTTFASRGLARTSFGVEKDSISFLIRQTGGELLAVGNTEGFEISHIAMARYLPGGSFDPTFGDGGRLVLDDPLLNAVASDVAIQPDGKLVLAGTGSIITNVSRDVLAVIRLNADGSLDREFADQGLAAFDPTQGDVFTSAVALQPDGKILVAGVSYVPNGNGGTNSVMLVARLDREGKLDEAFGVGGIAIINGSKPINIARAMAVNKDGTIVVGGYTAPLSGSFGSRDSDLALARLNPDGTARHPLR